MKHLFSYDPIVYFELLISGPICQLMQFCSGCWYKTENIQSLKLFRTENIQSLLSYKS